MSTERRLTPYRLLSSRQGVRGVFVENVNASTPSLSMGSTSDIWNGGGILVQQAVAQRLRFVSSSADDTLLGTGARQIFVSGLDNDFNLQTETVNLSGLTPVLTTNTYRRHFRTSVSTSGTSATTVISSLAGTLTIDWESTTDLAGIISPNDSAGFSEGSTRATHITVQEGHTGHISRISLFVDGTKPVSGALMFRFNADTTSAPFGSVQVAAKFETFTGLISIVLPDPFSFPEKTDIWLATVASANGTVVEGSFGLTEIQIS